MKKITDPNELDALANLASSGQKGYGVLKKIFKENIEELSSIMNIDSKGNMGLQALARQHAVEILLGIAENIFPDEKENISSLKKTGDKPISQWR